MAEKLVEAVYDNLAARLSLEMRERCSLPGETSIMGRSSTEMTERYIGIRDEELVEAMRYRPRYDFSAKMKVIIPSGDGPDLQEWISLYPDGFIDGR